MLYRLNMKTWYLISTKGKFENFSLICLQQAFGLFLRRQKLIKDSPYINHKKTENSISIFLLIKS